MSPFLNYGYLMGEGEELEFEFYKIFSTKVSVLQELTVVKTSAPPDHICWCYSPTSLPPPPKSNIINQPNLVLNKKK